jgi:hypothetical protein
MSTDTDPVPLGIGTDAATDRTVPMTPPVPGRAEAPAAPGLDALDTYPDLDGDDAWPVAGPRSGIRVPVPVAALSLVVVALLGAAGGARLKGTAAAPSAAAGPGGVASAGAREATGRGAGGPGGAGAPGGAVSGTVQSVDGDRVTLTATNGQTVTVTLAEGTTIARTTAGGRADIVAGETLTVRGTTGADGTTAAASITIGAPAGGRTPAPAPSTTAAP